MEKRFNMRKTPLLSLLAIFVLLVAGATALPARAQTGPNLLENPGFENGHYNQDGIPQITVPNGWRMYWSNDELIFGGEWVTTRPETIVWNIKGSPPGEEFYWKDGAYTMKVFNTWAPLWAALAQDVEGLQVGTKYRLSVPIYIDVFADYEGGQKIAPPPEHKSMAKVRLGAGPVGATWRDETAIGYSGWWTADSIAEFYQAYPLFVYDFTATQPNMTVYIEMASAYPFPHNGFFFDTPSLVSLGGAPAAAAPAANPAAGQSAASQPAAPVQAQPAATIVPPTPRPDGSIVHTVVAGDTLWVIAIQYADVLGLAPLDALAAIRELNNDPTFINPGDEILIKAGTGEAAAATPGEGTAAATTDAVTGEATTEGAAGTPAADATPNAAVGGDATVEPSAATDAAGATGSDAATPAAVAGTICVGAFLDANADGQRNEGEELVANAAVAISRGGTTVSTYITDGVSEPYCFELAEADSYQLQLYPPAGLAATTEDNWAVSIANGESYTVLFGLGNAPAADAAAADAATQPTAGDQAAATDTTGGTVDDATANDGGLFSGQLGIIVLGVGGFLLVLAALGVYLLRRG